MMLDKNIFDRWAKWAQAIKQDLIQVVDDQQTFDGFREVVTANSTHIAEHHGRRFRDFVQRSYATQAAVGVRRHLKHNKKDKESISLLRLMEQVHECAEQFTYEFYLSCHPDDEVIDESCTPCDTKEAEDFEKEASSPSTHDDKVVAKGQIADNTKPCESLGKETISEFFPDSRLIAKDIIANDIKAAKDLGKGIEDFVDRQLAHLDKRGYQGDATYDSLHKMIDLFDDLACKYIELITGDSVLSLKREIQFDWKEVFRVPLDVRGSPKPHVA